MADLVLRADKSSKGTIVERLTESLREDILGGALAPGQRLNLERMREPLAVSVSSLREAITRLVADGLIIAVPQRGYTVTPVSLGNLHEVTQLRMVIEPYALRTAITNGGLDWETDIMAALYRLNHTQRDQAIPETLELWERAHNAFHATLVERCDMPLLLEFHRSLMQLNDRYRRIFLSKGAAQRKVSDEHTDIAEATVAGNANKASELLTAHIERTGSNLKRRLIDSLPVEER